MERLLKIEDKLIELVEHEIIRGHKAVLENLNIEMSKATMVYTTIKRGYIL